MTGRESFYELYHILFLALHQNFDNVNLSFFFIDIRVTNNEYTSFSDKRRWKRIISQCSFHFFITMLMIWIVRFVYINVYILSITWWYVTSLHRNCMNTQNQLFIIFWLIRIGDYRIYNRNPVMIQLGPTGTISDLLGLNDQQNYYRFSVRHDAWR